MIIERLQGRVRKPDIGNITSVMRNLYQLDEEKLIKLTYDDHFANLQLVVDLCIMTSKQYAGIASETSQQAYASALFTTLCVKGTSLLNILPCTKRHRSQNNNWDFPSTASITRAIVEARLTLFYLCIDKISSVEWECRWNLSNLHDCTRRQALFELIDKNGEECKRFAETREELKQRLEDNIYFQEIVSSDQQKRNQLLSGRSAYLEPLEQIAEKVGLHSNYFKWLHMFLSNQVHSLPMSYIRMLEEDWGKGIYNKRDEGYNIMCISISILMLLSAKDEINELFS